MKPNLRGQPKGSPVGSLVTMTSPLPLTSRMTWCGIVYGTTSSVSPIVWIVRIDSSSRPTPRG